MGKIRDIKKTLKKFGASEEIIDYVWTQIKNKNDIIEQKSKLLEVLNKKCCSVGKRYFEHIVVNSSSSKITINPCTGRVTLKSSNKCSDQVKLDYVSLCNKIMIDDTIEPMTMRGKIKYKDDKYFIDMASSSKRFKKRYELIS